MKGSFKHIKRTLTKDQLFSILKNPMIDRKGKNVYAQCPWCGYDEFGVSLEEGNQFGCFRKKNCGVKGNIFTLLKKVDRMDLLGGGTYSIDTIDETILDYEVEVDDVFKFDVDDTNLPIGYKRVYDDEYLNERGFDREDYEYYEVGTNSLYPALKDRIVIPIVQFGLYRGYLGRSKRSKKWIDAYNKKNKKDGLRKRYPRYYNMPGVDFSKLLYGFDRLTEKTHTGILVEGFFGVKNVDEILGLKNEVEVKCMATFGGLSMNQLFLLKNYSNLSSLIVLFDNDATEKTQDISFDVGKIFDVKIGYFKDDIDSGGIGSKGLMEILNNLETPFDFWRNKVLIRKLL